MVQIKAIEKEDLPPSLMAGGAAPESARCWYRTGRNEFRPRGTEFSAVPSEGNHCGRVGTTSVSTALSVSTVSTALDTALRRDQPPFRT